MTEHENKALKDFLLDISCLNALDNWKDEVNIFDVLKVTNTEIHNEIYGSDHCPVEIDIKL